MSSGPGRSGLNARAFNERATDAHPSTRSAGRAESRSRGDSPSAPPCAGASEKEFSADILSTLSGVVTKLASRPDSRISAFLMPLRTVIEAMKEAATTQADDADPAPAPARDTAEAERGRGAGGNSTSSRSPASQTNLPCVEAFAATLHFNSMTPEDGYDCFDVDKDGLISRTDLRIAAAALKIDIPPGHMASLFDALDVDQSGTIDRGEWSRVLREANGERVCEERRCRHLDAADSAMAAANQMLQAGDIEGAQALRAKAEQELALAGEGMVGDLDEHISASHQGTRDGGGGATMGNGSSNDCRMLTPNVQLALDIIAATLVYNKMDASRGYAAFDMDHDGVVSYSDLQGAAKCLQLDVAVSDLRALFDYTEASDGGKGYIGKGAWEAALEQAQAHRVLKQVLSPSLIHTIDRIAEVIVFNEMTPEKAFEAFDVDKDGSLSLADLRTACDNLGLEGVTAEHVQELFAFLDQDESGFVDRQEWAIVVRHAGMAAQLPQQVAGGAR